MKRHIKYEENDVSLGKQLLILPNPDSVKAEDKS